MHGTCASAEQRIRRACAVADSLGMSAAAQVHTAILQLAAAARSAAQSHVAARLRVPDAAVRLLLACLEALHTVSFLDVSLTLTVLAAAVCVGSPAGMRLGKAPRRRPRSSVLQPGSAMRTQILHLSAMKLFPPHSCKWSADLQERLDGRWVLECGGGGNCLFHVLSFLLHGRPDFHEELRAAVAEFFGTTDNAEHEVYKKLQEEIELGDIDGCKYTSMENYAGALLSSTPPMFGSFRYELPALAHLLGLQVDLVLEEQVAADSLAADQFRGQRVGVGRHVSMLFRNVRHCAHSEDAAGAAAQCSHCGRASHTVCLCSSMVCTSKRWWLQRTCLRSRLSSKAIRATTSLSAAVPARSACSASGMPSRPSCRGPTPSLRWPRRTCRTTCAPCRPRDTALSPFKWRCADPTCPIDSLRRRCCWACIPSIRSPQCALRRGQGALLAELLCQCHLHMKFGGPPNLNPSVFVLTCAVCACACQLCGALWWVGGPQYAAGQDDEACGGVHCRHGGCAVLCEEERAVRRVHSRRSHTRWPADQRRTYQQTEG